MRLASRASSLVLLALVSGCAGTVQPKAPEAGKYALPNGKGFFDVRVEGQAPARRGARSEGHKATLVASFFGSDGTSPVDPAPTDVVVKIGTAAAEQRVSLRPTAGDPKAAGRFVSEPSSLPDGFRGILTAKVGGESVEVPFEVR